LILGAALIVIGQIGYKLLHPGVPLFGVMGVVGALALAANGTCLGLLWKHRAEDVNMASVWECSRNDIAGNLAVLLAAAAVWFVGSGWPDLVIGSPARRAVPSIGAPGVSRVVRCAARSTAGDLARAAL
jgi:Co/Zn/Cd efflux system component